MADVQITFNNAGLAALAYDEDVLKYCDEAGRLIERGVRRRINNVTGRSARALNVERGGSGTDKYVEISTMWYLIFPDQGTKYQRAQHIVDNAIEEARSAL